jgi:hypothetical protein
MRQHTIKVGQFTMFFELGASDADVKKAADVARRHVGTAKAPHCPQYQLAPHLKAYRYLKFWKLCA